VDTSAILAIILNEQDSNLFKEALVGSDPLMSTATRIELAHVVLRRLGPDGLAEVDGLLSDFGFRFVPLDEEQSTVALHALTAFGKGRGAPPAVLNMGDTFSYALAKTRDLPLLYKGEDFARTDIRSALAERGGRGDEAE